AAAARRRPRTPPRLTRPGPRRRAAFGRPFPCRVTAAGGSFGGPHFRLLCGGGRVGLGEGLAMHSLLEIGKSTRSFRASRLGVTTPSATARRSSAPEKSAGDRHALSWRSALASLERRSARPPAYLTGYGGIGLRHNSATPSS